MAKTRFRKPVQFIGVMSAATVDFASLAISTTFTPPAMGITLGLGTDDDQTSKLDGVYISFSFDGASSASLTHNIGATCIGWIVTRTDAALATAQGQWCGSTLANCTSILNLCSNGTCDIMVFAF